MKRTIGRWVGVLLAALLLLAGCGTSIDSSKATDTIVDSTVTDDTNTSNNDTEAKGTQKNSPVIVALEPTLELPLHFDGDNDPLIVSDGLTAFLEGDAYGYMDVKGQVVIPCEYDFEYSLPHFSEGFANTGAQFIDTDGNPVFPGAWANAPFSEGLAWVYTADGTCFIDTTGQTALAIPDGVLVYTSFCDGLASTSAGFVDKTGEVVIPGDFWGITFKDGFAVIEQDGDCIVIDKKGNKAFSYSDISANHSGSIESRHLGDGLIPITSQKDMFLHGYADMEGNIAIPMEERWGDAFSEGLAVVSISRTQAEDRGIDTEGMSMEGVFGYINRDNELVVPYKYRDARSFSEGLARVQDKNRLWGFIDKEGNEVVACKYEAVCAFNEGYAWVKEDGLWGLLQNTAY